MVQTLDEQVDRDPLDSLRNANFPGIERTFVPFPVRRSVPTGPG
jgi:hypothetical protein